MFNYIEQANRTKSDKFYGEKVSHRDFMDTLSTAIMALIELDRMKKALFYGKGADITSEPTVASLEISEVIDIDLLHGIIGCATEAGEMLEALNRVLSCNETFDSIDCTNLKEEIFDTQWYHAIMCRKLGITFEEGQKTNIDKLRARFPEKFTEQRAIHRDLAAERAILENKK